MTIYSASNGFVIEMGGKMRSFESLRELLLQFELQQKLNPANWYLLPQYAS
jgi:hypothetical protein